MNPFEIFNKSNATYLNMQDEKLEKCKQKALELSNELDGLDSNHKNLLAEWVAKTAFFMEFMKQIQSTSPNP
ncbi:MAG: hypothetical protein II611_02460 [Treponema sp.]|nr:hypothetical protein [Treponema sp.]